MKNDLITANIDLSDMGIPISDVERLRSTDPSFDQKVNEYKNKLSSVKSENEVRELGEEVYTKVNMNREKLLSGTKGLDLGETSVLMDSIATLSTEITEQYEHKNFIQKWIGSLKKRQISHGDIVSQLDVVEGNINKVTKRLELSMDALKEVGTSVRQLGDDLLPVVVALQDDIEKDMAEMSIFDKDSLEYHEREYALAVKMNRVKELLTLRLISREQTRECLLIYATNLHWINELKHNSKITLPVLQHVAMQRVGINAAQQAANLASALKEVTAKSLEIAGRDIADNLEILQATKEGLLSVDTIEKVINVVNDAVEKLQQSRRECISGYKEAIAKAEELDKKISF